MKNQKALIITIALFLALISLSCAASQGPMNGEELSGLPYVRHSGLQVTKEQKIKNLKEKIEHLKTQRVGVRGQLRKDLDRQIADIRKEINRLKRQK
jgi:septal ring factor EnvC (AmiA/AmiB activator)